MDAAGLPPDYSSHSIRVAVSTKAIQQDVSVDQVKQLTNWSQTSNTFERYYYKPSQQQHDSTRVQNQLFSLAEKGTTSETEAEATRIVVGTTYNSSFIDNIC